ncbi:MAG: hypothetical protein ABMA64_34045, partial [Myxococcota bacterium]
LTAAIRARDGDRAGAAAAIVDGGAELVAAIGGPDAARALSDAVERGRPFDLPVIGPAADVRALVAQLVGEAR